MNITQKQKDIVIDILSHYEMSLYELSIKGQDLADFIKELKKVEVVK